MKRIALSILLALAAASPAFSMTYKSSYPVPCSEVWGAVKETLGNTDNYAVVSNDDGKMTASYNVKHAVHVNVTGAILQRTNKVTLVSKGNACEMQVVSNFSGWEHNDRDDFKKRVDDALAKTKSAAPATEAAKAVDPSK